MKNFDSAINTFQKIISQNGNYTSDAEYFLMLSYLGNNQLDDDFKDLLNKIIQDQNHPYYKESQAIQQKLKSIWRRFS